MEIILIICMLLGTFKVQNATFANSMKWRNKVYCKCRVHSNIKVYVRSYIATHAVSGTVRLQYCSAGALGETDQCITVKAQNKYPTKVSEAFIF